MMITALQKTAVIFTLCLTGMVAWAEGSQQQGEIVNRVAIFHDGTKRKLTAVDENGQDLVEWFKSIPQIDFGNGVRGETMIETQARLSAYVATRHSRVREIIWPQLLALGLQSALYTYRQQFTVPYPTGPDAESFYINYSLLVQADGNYSILQSRVLPESPTFLIAYHTGRNTGTGDLPTDMPPATHQDLLILSLIDGEGNKVKITPESYVVTLNAPAYHLAEWELTEGVNTYIRDKHDCVMGTLDPTHRAIVPYETEAPQTFSSTPDGESTPLTIAKVICEGKNIQEILDDKNYRVRSVVGVYLGALENYDIADEATQRITERELNERGCGLDHEYTNTWEIGIEPYSDIYYYSLSPTTREADFLRVARYEAIVDEQNWFADVTEVLRESLVERRIKAKTPMAEPPKNNEIVYPLTWEGDVVTGTLVSASSVTLAASLPAIFSRGIQEGEITLANRKMELESNNKCHRDYHCWGNYWYSTDFPLRTTFSIDSICKSDHVLIKATWDVGDGLPNSGSGEKEFVIIPGREEHIFSNSNPKGISIYFDGNRAIKAVGLIPPGENPGCSDDRRQDNRPSDGAYSYLTDSKTVREPVLVQRRYCTRRGKDGRCTDYSSRLVQAGGSCTYRCGKGNHCCRRSGRQYRNRTTCPNIANRAREPINLIEW